MPVDTTAREALQNRIINGAANSLRAGKDAVIIAPTGFGKTNMFTRAILDHLDRDPSNKALVLQNLQVLAEQNSTRARSLGLSGTSISYDGRLDQTGRAVYALPDTASAHVTDLSRYSLVVIDECHHCTADPNNELSLILKSAKEKNPDLRILAVTGTFIPPVGQQLHPAIMAADQHRVSWRDALATRAIVPAETVTPPIRLANGRTITDTLAGIFDPLDPIRTSQGIPKLLRQQRPADFEEKAVSIWKQQTAGTPPYTFAYIETTKDADRLTRAFNQAGILARSVHSGMPRNEIDRAFADYENGRVNVLVSVDMLTEGVDQPKTRHILNCKEKVTLTEWIQMAGRASRAATYLQPDGTKQAKAASTIIDLGASTIIHGTIAKRTEVEAYALHGPSATGWRAWKAVSAQPKTLLLQTPDRSIYAVATGKNTFVMLQATRDPSKANARHGSKLRLKPMTPARANPIDLARIARDECAAHTAFITTLESHPSVREIYLALHAEAAPSIARILSSIAPARKQHASIAS